MIFLIIIALIAFVIIKIFKRYKKLKLGSLCLITGGVKSGKSTLSVYFVIKKYKSILRATKFVNFFRKLFKKELLELPLLYSNVPLGLPYVEITKDLLMRKKRFRYGSVVYIQEASLVADSQLIQDKELNEKLLLFNKLIAHSGVSCLIYDTQCIGDIHYTIKRSLSNYFYIHHLNKCLFLPFLICYVQEYRYSDDGTVVAITGDKDLEDNLRKVIISKKTWKMFDSHCYSVLTDNLPVEDKVIKPDLKNLKIDKIISFRDGFENLIQQEKVEEKSITKNLLFSSENKIKGENHA